ncbi:MAG TPA: DUF4198 domain-containing protein [Kiritimatiellia bacterium]|nr:DUF4198 domain-containing protein [Kiritimatiellia bacterium]HMP97562.1 DUF4198 domain-containing protein [Kiritimatiellia bacterium]
MKRRVRVGIFAPLLIASVAAGHDYWIVAEPAFPEPGTPVTLRLCGGHRPPDSEFLIADRMIVRVEATGPYGVEALTSQAMSRHHEAIWTPKTSGVYRVGFTLKRPRDEQPIAEARTLVVAGDVDDPSAYASAEGLELVPHVEVSAWRAGAALPLAIFHQGEPVAGEIEMTTPRGKPVFRRSSPGQPALFTSPAPGWHLFTVRHAGRTASLLLQAQAP